METEEQSISFVVALKWIVVTVCQTLSFLLVRSSQGSGLAVPGFLEKDEDLAQARPIPGVFIAVIVESPPCFEGPKAPASSSARGSSSACARWVRSCAIAAGTPGV